MDANDNAEYTPYIGKKMMFFGRDLGLIPCFRNSWLFGISGGIGAGLACFLGTSNARKSYHTAFISSLLITSTYWIVCRYNYDKQLEDLQKMRDYVEKRVLMDGVEMEKVHEATENAETVSV